VITRKAYITTTTEIPRTAPTAARRRRKQNGGEESSLAAVCFTAVSALPLFALFSFSRSSRYSRCSRYPGVHVIPAVSVRPVCHDLPPTNGTGSQLGVRSENNCDRTHDNSFLLHGVIHCRRHRHCVAVESSSKPRRHGWPHGDRVSVEHVAPRDVKRSVRIQHNPAGCIAERAADVKMHRRVADDQTGALSTPIAEREQAVTGQRRAGARRRAGDGREGYHARGRNGPSSNEAQVHSGSGSGSQPTMA